MNFESMTEQEIRDSLNQMEPEWRAIALMELGYRLASQERRREAEAPVSAARQLFIQLGDEAGEARASYAEAQLLRGRDEYEQAAKLFDRVLHLWGAFGDDVRLADSHFGVGVCQGSLGEYKAATISFNQACDIYLRLGHFSNASKCRSEIGEMLGFSGMQSKAILCFEDALSYAKADKNLQLTAKAHDRVASALIDLGKADVAVQHLRDALSIWKFTGEQDELPYALRRLAEGLTMLDLHQEARELLEEAVVAYRTLGNFAESAAVETSIAAILTEIGFHDDARLRLENAIPVLSAAGSSSDLLEAKLVRLQTQSIDDLIEGLGALIEEAGRLEELWFASTSRVTLALKFLERNKRGDTKRARKALGKLEETSWGEALINQARFLLALGVILQRELKIEEARAVLERMKEIGTDQRFINLRSQAVILATTL